MIWTLFWFLYLIHECVKYQTERKGQIAFIFACLKHIVYVEKTKCIHSLE